MELHRALLEAAIAFGARIVLGADGTVYFTRAGIYYVLSASTQEAPGLLYAVSAEG